MLTYFQCCLFILYLLLENRQYNEQIMCWQIMLYNRGKFDCYINIIKGCNTDWTTSKDYINGTNLSEIKEENLSIFWLILTINYRNIVLIRYI